MGDHLHRQEPNQSSQESEPRVLQMATSLISGATSLSNVNINSCTVIGQQHNIQSVDSSPEKKENVWFKMREPIASYTGRQGKLNQVHNLFFLTNKRIKPIHQIAIVGLGGVGKSEFARKFAKLYYIHTKYYNQLDGHVVWISAESSQLLIDSFKQLATRIGINSADLSGKAEILQMVDQVYEYFDEKQSLFIFDNVEDWADGENAVKDYLPNRMAPGVKKPFVLLTSRIKPSGIKVIELSVLTTAEAVELIKTRLEVKQVECTELLVQLANLLGCLPLALQQASSYVKQEMESDISGKQQDEIIVSCIETYIKMFEVETEKLLDYKPGEMDVNFEELKTTLLTWRITLDKIQELNPNALQLLGMMAYISSADIYLEMFEAQFTVDNLKDAVNTLVRFSMITKNSKNSNIVSVHRLVQRVVRMDNDDEGKSLESMLNLLGNILEELPDKITSYTTSCVIHSQVAWEYALALSKLLKRFQYYPSNLYNKAELHGMHRTNLSLLQRTLSKYNEYSIYGESNEQYIRIQHLITCALLELHKCEDAKSLCKLIHKTAEEKLGESNSLTLGALYNLALAESGLGNYSEELTIYGKLIAIRSASPHIGPYDKDMLVYYLGKAGSLGNMGKYDEALDLFKTVLESSPKEDRRSINETRIWIALMTRRQGNFVEALQMFRNLHAELVDSFGKSHTKTLQCAWQIGECLLGLDEYEEAMEVLKYNLTLAKDNPGAGLECVNMKFSLASVLFQLERYEEAISQLRIVLGEQLSIKWETHPVVLNTRELLAVALQVYGSTVEALEHYEFVYENRVKALGAEHQDTIVVKYAIAQLLLKMGRCDESISHFRTVLEEKSSIYEETHLEVLTTRVWLAQALQNAGCTGEALQHYEFVFENLLKTLGPYHPDTILVKKNMGTILNS